MFSLGGDTLEFTGRQQLFRNKVGAHPDADHSRSEIQRLKGSDPGSYSTCLLSCVAPWEATGQRHGRTTAKARIAIGTTLMAEYIGLSPFSRLCAYWAHRQTFNLDLPQPEGRNRSTSEL